MSEDLSRTGTPSHHHGDSDSDGNADPGHRRHQPATSTGVTHSGPAGGLSALAGIHSALASGGLLSSVHPSGVSLGPPLPPPPHLLPYLYPGAMYPGGLHQLSQLLHHPAGPHPPGALGGLGAMANAHMAGHNLLLNAQLALAAQHQLFHPYQNLSAALAASASAPSMPLAPPPVLPPVLPPPGSTTPPSDGRLKQHRFAPYSLSSPNGHKSTSSASSNGQSSAFETVSPKSSPKAPPSPTGSVASSSSGGGAQHAAEIKSIEKMVNGIDDSPKSPIQAADSTSESKASES